MGQVINLFSPSEEINLEQYKDQLPGHMYENLKELLVCGPGDIARTLFWGGEFVGAIKLAYRHQREVGFIRCEALCPIEQSLLPAVEEGVAEFIRLCFGTYRRLDVIHWNAHPEDQWKHQVCQALAFDELPPAQAFVHHGVRYRSFALKRLP